MTTTTTTTTAAVAAAALETRGLSKTFGHGELAVTAVRAVDLTVAPGEVVLVDGPSGSGKTTLLLMLGALLEPTAGSVIVDGDAVFLAAGELVGTEVGAVAEPDSFECAVGQLAGVAAGDAGEVGGEGDVLGGREGAEEVEVLEHEPEVACPE